jgi:hypothetical protein
LAFAGTGTLAVLVAVVVGGRLAFVTGYGRFVVVMVGLLICCAGALLYYQRFSTFTIEGRHLSLGMLTVTCLTLLVQFLPEENAILAAVKLLFATATIGLIPGMLLVLALRPLPKLTLLELTGIGAAISLSLAQLLSIASLSLRIGSGVMGLSLAALLIAGSVGLFLRQSPDTENEVTIRPQELAISLMLLFLAALLYMHGSPFASGEDRIHASIIRRLVLLPNPSLTNIYFAPDVIYTYPYPGTHHFMALVSRLGGLDSLFVYHKLRFFWGPTAIIFVYLGAQLVFESREIALVTVLTAILFVLGGAFAHIRPFFWAQLVPFSHTSDVAMNVLLPGLLVLSFYFLQSQEMRKTVFFFVSSLALVLMLTIVHIREIIQFLVYYGSFALALMVFKQDRTYLKKTVLLIVSTLLVVALYGLWQSSVVGHTNILVESRRAVMLNAISRFSAIDYLRYDPGTPYMAHVEFDVFYGWNPIILFTSSALFVAFRRRTLVLLVGTSLFVYLLIIRFPLFAIPYIYITYWEILISPVRNMIFFIYLLTGAFFYLIASALRRITNVPLAALAGSAVAVLLGLVWKYGVTAFGLKDEVDRFFAPTVILYLLAFSFMLWELYWRPKTGLDEAQFVDRTSSPPESSFRKLAARSLTPGYVPLGSHRTGEQRNFRQSATMTTWPVWGSALLLVLPLAAGAAKRQSSPLNAPDQLLLTPDALISAEVCIPTQLGPRSIKGPLGDVEIKGPDDASSCSPSLQFVRWVREELPADAVLAVNSFNQRYPLPFISQQIVVSPILGSTLYLDIVFPTYYDFLTQSIEQHQTQPFFNTHESLEERIAFVEALQVTHIVVDPMYYDEMKQTLDQWPNIFQVVYDDEEWAIYQVGNDQAGDSETNSQSGDG